LPPAGCAGPAARPARRTGPAAGPDLCGRLLATFFLLDEEAHHYIAAGKSKFSFACDLGACRTINARRPEAAIAYDQGQVEQFYASAGMDIRPPIYHGAWSGRPGYLSSQDLIIAARR